MIDKTIQRSVKFSEDSWWEDIDGKSYAFMNDPSSWAEAVTKCQTLKGRLFEPKDDAANKKVNKKVFNFYFDKGMAMVPGAWIGVTVTNGEKNTAVYNSDQSPVHGDFGFVVVPKSIWAPGEPNNAGSNEGCVSWATNVKDWNDADCSTKMPFVCEKGM